MKKVSIYFVAVVLAFWMVGLTEAALISFLEEDGFAGVDGDTTGWSNDDSLAVLSASSWSLLDGMASVYGYIDGGGILTHRGTRGLGINGREDDEVDYSPCRHEKVKITFSKDFWVHSLEVRSLFKNDGWSPGTELGTIDFYRDGSKIYTENLQGLESLGAGNDGDVPVSYPTAWLVDKLVYYVPSGLGISSTESEFVIARLNVESIPEPVTIMLLGFGGLALLRKRRA